MLCASDLFLTRFAGSGPWPARSLAADSRPMAGVECGAACGVATAGIVFALAVGVVDACVDAFVENARLVGPLMFPALPYESSFKL